MKRHLQRPRFHPWYLLPAFLLVVAVLLLSQLSTIRGNSEIRAQQALVGHTQEVLARLEQVRSGTLWAESAVRGYVIGRRLDMMEPFQEALTLLPLRLEELRALSVDSASQRDKQQRLKTMLDQRVSLLRQLAETAPGDPKLRDLVDQGSTSMREVTAILDSLSAEEQSNLRKRTTNLQATVQNADRAYFASSAFTLGLSVLVFALLRRQLSRDAREAWLQKNLASANSSMAKEDALLPFCRNVLEFLTSLLAVPSAAFYTDATGEELVLTAGFALPAEVQEGRRVAPADGVVGQAAQSKRLEIIRDGTRAIAPITTPLIRFAPCEVILIPLVSEEVTIGVLELCVSEPLAPEFLDLLEEMRPLLAGGLQSALNRRRLQGLLEETQAQSEELQAQQEELRQQNEELEQQARVLEEQQLLVSQRNDHLQLAQRELQEQARQLSEASKYKSQFLSNMSHELRTPLNSLLILSTLLMDNKAGRLSHQEVEFARTIHNSGNDLLTLINDILDLAKIESGTVTLEKETFTVDHLLENLSAIHRPVAQQKSLRFEIFNELPGDAALHTDRLRLEQILRNLLSNALKFTEKGQVALTVRQDPSHVRFTVSDSGVGIPEEKLAQIFEAFQQADGSTSRKYGGTGLGLTISRELASLLAGRIEVSSKPGEGSSFTLNLPRSAQAGVEAGPVLSISEPATVPHYDLLIVEDDPVFGQTLSLVAAEAGFSSLVVHDGEAALSSLEQRTPTAILLDVKLPTVSGLAVLESLKGNPRTRHIPVHMISGIDHAQAALRLGAMGYLLKPASKDKILEVMSKVSALSQRVDKAVLIVEDDPLQRSSLAELLRETGSARCDTAATGAEAGELLAKNDYDCVILDLRLPDMTGFDLLQRMESGNRPLPPVVVYTGKDLTRQEADALRRYSDNIIIKGARSPQRLLEEVSLFLHHLQAEPSVQSVASEDAGTQFVGRKVLLVDDDLRNTFALISALEPEGFQCVIARNGLEALQALEDDEDLELVLMDTMMPEMDGLEATRRIRENPKYRKLPIISLTAKAMREDQENCLAAGANDYLTKPFKLEHLFSLLRVWLPVRDFHV